MRKLSLGLAVTIILSASCVGQRYDDVMINPNERPTADTAQPSSEPASSASTSAPLASVAPSATDRPLPTEGACDTAKDCDYDYTHLVDGQCCKGTCTPRASAFTTIVEVTEACAKRGWNTENCPMKKCAAPPPLACQDHHCVLITPPATGPITSKEDAVDRAVIAANAALDKSYARFSAQKGVIAPKHDSTWVRANGATVDGPAANGTYKISWSVIPPSGHAIKATVTVSKAGDVVVADADASFSPD